MSENTLSKQTENTKKISPWTVVIYIFFCIMSVIYLAPIIWVVISSLKTRKELIKAPFALPEVLQWGNYTYAWTAGKLGVAMRNSVIVCVVTLALTMIIGSMAAFAIGKMQWKLANFSMTYILMSPDQRTLSFVLLISNMINYIFQRIPSYNRL